MSNAEVIQGSCLCRSVRWQAHKPFEEMAHCYCSMCRKSHGAPFVTTVAADARGFSWQAGEELIVRYRSSASIERGFCGRCGSTTPELYEGKAWMAAGCLDEDPGTRPNAHLFTGSKAPWYVIPDDDLPRYDGYPPGSALSAIDRPRPEQASEAGWVRGTCLCEDVVYELTAGDWMLTLCHCSRCRKGRAAAHAGNMFVEDAQLRWLRGEGQLRRYNVPEAARFAQTFCARCGSPQPRAAGNRYVVPVSTLDADPGITAMRHIYVGSKAPWFEIRDAWPQFVDGPPA